MGKIASYKTGECFLCGKKFKGKAGLYYHFKRSKRHWELRKKFPIFPKLQTLLEEYIPIREGLTEDTSTGSFTINALPQEKYV